MEVLELFSRWPDKHVAHKEGMVCAGAHDADMDSVSFVPSGIAVDDIDAIPRVEVIYSSFAVDFPYLIQ